MAVLDLPEIVFTLLPPNDASIWDILQHKLPPIADEPLDSPFSAKLGQPGLWIIKFWEQVEYLRWVQAKWQPRLDWLVKQRTCDVAIPSSRDVYDNTIACLKYLNHDERLSIRGRPARGEDLEDVAARLLSSQWLSSGVIEHMLDVLQARMEAGHSSNQTEPTSLIIPPGLYNPFISALRSAEVQEREYRPPQAARVLTPWIEKQDSRDLLFVLNINNTHWVACCADLRDHVIRVGDSMGTFCGVRDALAPLQAWFRHLFGEEFRLQYNLPSGEQKDSNSCGLFSVNALASYALGDPTITHEGRNMTRAVAFLEIAKRHIVTMNRPNDISPLLTSGDIVDGPESGFRRLIDISDNSDDEQEQMEYSPGVLFDSSLEPSSSANEQRGWREDVIKSDVETNMDGEVGKWMDTNTSSDGEVGRNGGESRFMSPSAGASTESLFDLGTQLNLNNEPDMDTVFLSAPVLEVRESGRAGTKRKSSPLDMVVDESADDEPATESEAESRDSSHEQAGPKRLRKRTKRVKTAVYDKAALESLANGTFALDLKRWDRFTKEIYKLDKHAAFKPEENPRVVRHSKCNQWLKMHLPYHTKRFKEHCKLQNCRKGSLGEGMPLLSSFGFTRGKSSKSVKAAPTKPSIVLKTSACRGLKEADYPGVDRYIGRTSYSGGGSQSITKYAQEMFGHKYRRLEQSKKDEVLARSYQDQQWRVAHIAKAIFSTRCLQTVEHPISTPPPPCTNCLLISKVHEFKNAVRRPEKEPRNLKYTNHRFVNTSSGLVYANTKGVAELLAGNDRKTVAARFAAKIILKPDSENTVFFGLAQALLTADSKERRGLYHSVSLAEYISYISLKTPRPGLSSKMQSRELKFPLAIGPEVFVYAKTYFEQINYAGPICLSCDDTKLLSSLRMYYEKHTKQWQLIGGTDGPVNIANNNELVKALKDATIEKASKVRLWVLQAALPGIAPLAIAALPIASSISAVDLAEHLRTVLDGLFDESGLQIVSYAADGNVVEQNVQNLVFRSSDTTQEYRILYRTQGLDGNEVNLGTTFQLRFYKGHPLVMIQDSKHALKTCRNNLFSGARLLVLGNHLIFYAQVREMAFDDSSTLYRRDVEKLDRQDDQAATRLFCAATLEFTISHRPNNLALAVYLFICGEACDAIQSRKASHAERARMVMRARYFFGHWKTFLNESGYPLSRYFISREASNILSRVIDGLMLLIYVYRDHFNSEYPLLPWLHSTEACEHMFGELRKPFYSGSFTYYDMLYALPKLRVILRTSYQAGCTTGKSKKATGYQHTYMDHSDIDLTLLATFPTDYEVVIDKIARVEAANLARVLGMSVSELSVSPPVATPTPNNKPCPKNPEPKICEQEDINYAVSMEDKEPLALEVLREFIQLTESDPLPSASVSQRRDNVIYAASALEVESASFIDALPSETAEDLKADRLLINDLLTGLQPRLEIPNIDESLFSSDQSHLEVLDPKALVPHRWAHQTKQAYKSPKNFRILVQSGK
ncbi:hypothetical protein FRC07_002060, partial [Ceratobasidium sp. 392]